MSRRVLAETQVNPNALNFIAQNHAAILDEVISTVGKNKIVIIGMSQNPFVKKARKALEATNTPFSYLSYGSYFSKWKERLAIKMWSGWPTYPQVFIDGKLIGGYNVLRKHLSQK